MKFVVAGGLLLLGAGWLLFGRDASRDSARLDVVLIDQTGFGADPQLDGESREYLIGVVRQAVDVGGRLIVMSIGDDVHSTRTLADLALAAPCENPHVCREEQASIMEDASATIDEILSDDDGAAATDLFGALGLASDTCRQVLPSTCQLHIVSDGVQNDEEASFLLPIPDEQATAGLIDRHRSEGRLPALSGVSVTWTGVGTDGGDSSRAAEITRFWTSYLTGAGAADVEISRTVSTA